MTSRSALDIVTAVKRDMQHVEESGFPLEIFPAKMQEILLHWAEHQGFKVEFSAMSMLAAIAAALGNTYRIRIKEDWTMNAVLYVILVGRPGLGKTPPLEAVMQPLQELDNKRLETFKKEMEHYQEQTASKKGEDLSGEYQKPKLVSTIISDFTPEYMLLAHANNPRGIIIHCDEVMGMFNSANRYNNSPLIEQLLSAWSGSQLKYTRVSNPIPIVIKEPCISIIGTTQPSRITELLQKGLKNNGFLDRMLYVLPKSQKIPLWKVEDCIGNSSNQEKGTAMADKWNQIMQRVIALDYRTYSFEGEERTAPNILPLDEEAAQVLTAWWNSILTDVNDIENDADIETRDMKLNMHVGRLALLFQVARFACGESHLQFIDAESMRNAIKLNDYLEDSYNRVIEAVEDSTDKLTLYYKALPDEFFTADAKRIAKQFGNCDRTTQNLLTKFVKEKKLSKVCHGKYQKTTANPFAGEDVQKSTTN